MTRTMNEKTTRVRQVMRFEVGQFCRSKDGARFYIAAVNREASTVTIAPTQERSKSKKHRPTHRKKKMLALRRAIKRMPVSDIQRALEMYMNKAEDRSAWMSSPDHKRQFYSIHKDLVRRLLALVAYW